MPPTLCSGDQAGALESTLRPQAGENDDSADQCRRIEPLIRRSTGECGCLLHGCRRTQGMCGTTGTCGDTWRWGARSRCQTWRWRWCAGRGCCPWRWRRRTGRGCYSRRGRRGSWCRRRTRQQRGTGGSSWSALTFVITDALQRHPGITPGDTAGLGVGAGAVLQGILRALRPQCQSEHRPRPCVGQLVKELSRLSLRSRAGRSGASRRAPSRGAMTRRKPAMSRAAASW
jgi:hypothetical protein